MKWILLIVLVIAGIVLLLRRRQRRDSAPPPPLEHRTVDIKDVAEYAEMSATTYRVRTLRDVLPGGLSAAMAPVLVGWSRSSFAPGGSISIRNLNHGGNPISGITVLRTAVLRPERLLRVEYVKVPLAHTHALSHGQLRFVFEPGGVELVGDDPSAVGEPDSFDDIVLSWEAWRPPGTGYSILKGMDPNVYRLTMRAYSGVQRFIEDALQKRDWQAYTLALPGGREGAMELLKVSLAMGDGAGRCVLSELFQDSNDAWVAGGPSGESEGDAAGSWAEIQSRLRDARKLPDQRTDLTGRTAYHSVVRSCASMALYQVDVATVRLIERGLPHPGGRPVNIANIDEIPEWMTELAQTNVAGLFLRGHKMIAFAHHNPGAIPGEIPKQLDEAGLLVRENGKPLKRKFNTHGETPWGPANHLLIR